MAINITSGGVPTGAPSGDTWQLASGHYLSTDVTGMTPTITYPRGVVGDGAGTEPLTLGSAEEMNDYAHAMNSYDDGSTAIAWEIPIVVQGGSWPFKYQIIGDTPTGLSIGETLTVSGDKQVVGDAYATLSWSAPIAGTYSFGIRVTDQDNNTFEMWWQHVAGSTNHIFVDDSATDDTGTGAIGDPLKTIDGLDGTTGKVAHFRNTTGTGEYETGLSVNAASTPVSFIAYPGEAVTFDMSVAQMSISADDFYIGGITCDGKVAASPNYKQFVLSNIVANDRATWYKNDFTNNIVDLAANDNPACIFSGGVSSGATREYISVIRNTHGSGTTVNMVDLFDCKYAVVEHNVSDGRTITAGTNGDFVFQIKDHCNNVSVRANIVTNCTMNGRGAINFNNQTVGNDGSGVESIANQECCYNLVEITSALDGSKYALGTNTTTDTPVTNTHSYRNSFVVTDGDGMRAVGPIVGNDDWNTQHNAIYAESEIINNNGYDDSNDALANQTFLITDFDSDGNLTNTNSARDNNLGIRGYEVA